MELPINVHKPSQQIYTSWFEEGFYIPRLTGLVINSVKDLSPSINDEIGIPKIYRMRFCNELK